MKSVARVEFRMFSSAASRAFGIVGVEQALRRAPVDHQLQLPDEIVDVLECRCWHRARRTATRRAPHRRQTARGHDGIAASAGTGTCRRSPIRCRTRPSSPSIARSRGRMRSGCFSRSGSASQPSWKSMRQTSSACRCSSADWFGMKRRIEPEPALGRKVRLHVDVGDQEAIAETPALPLRGRASNAPDSCEPSADDQPVARELVFAFRCCDAHQRRRPRAARRRRPCSASESPLAKAHRSRSTRHSSRWYCCRLTNAGRR